VADLAEDQAARNTHRVLPEGDREDSVRRDRQGRELDGGRHRAPVALAGLGFSDFDPRQPAARTPDAIDLDDATATLGFASTYTVGRDGLFADVGLQFLWPALWQNSENDAFVIDDWNLLLIISTFRAP
jgi:hypothetical protein